MLSIMMSGDSVSRNWVKEYVTAAQGTIHSTAITDPAGTPTFAAVTTAIVDAYGGVVITLTAAGNAQTIQDPTAITANKEFIVANNDTSTDPITVNGVVLAVGEAQKFFWDGSAWLTLEAVSASQISITDAGNIITATEVEGALQENRTAINLNTAKVTNVSTTLEAGTVNATSYGITSDGGADDIVLPEADTTNAGILGSDKWDEIVANTLKNTNVPTELSVGTIGASTVAITSDGGADDVILPASTTAAAGMATAAQITAVEANTAKVSYTPAIPGEIGGTTPAIVNTSILKIQPIGSQSVTAVTDTIVATSGNLNIGADADYVLTSTPTIAAGTDGQLLILQNTGSFQMDLQDNTILAGSTIFHGGSSGILAPGETMTVQFNSTVGGWVMQSHPNLQSATGSAGIVAVRNTSGSTIVKGAPVYVSGFNVGQGRATISLADADDAAKMPAIGVAAESIANNTNGSVVASGVIEGLDTSGGAVLGGVWVSTTAGTVVYARPVVDDIQQIGTVLRSHASLGSMLVVGAGRSNDVPITIAAKIKTITQPATDTLTELECSGTQISNYGQSAENTQTLPTAAAGLNGVVVIGTAGTGAFHLKAGATDMIYLDGIAMADAEKVSLATPSIGDFFSFTAFQTGAAAYDWIIRTGEGVIANGGA